MEEEKAAAYYDELSRKGEGAARFKRGLGFSSNATTDDAVPVKGSALPLSSSSSSAASSFLSKFVRASSPSNASDYQKQAQLESIQNKLKKKSKTTSPESQNLKQFQSSSKASIDRMRESDKDRDRDRHSRRRSLSRSRSPSRDRDRHSRRRSRSRSRDRDKYSTRRSRSRSRSSDGHRSRHRHRSRLSSRNEDRDRRREKERDRERKRRSRSPATSEEEGGRRRERRSRSRSRSVSPREWKSKKSEESAKVAKERNGGTDYSKMIAGYDNMTPAERVKAKMKIQLSETAEKDESKGSGWERFEFNKDAPLEDEDIEAAEDDAILVKSLGQSFRFSAMEARKEEEIKTAHDEAIFGASAHQLSSSINEVRSSDRKETTETELVTSLISEQVLSRQQGSWRERARKL